MIRVDPELVSAARAGSRSALEALARALQRPIFNLAIRMLANSPDAEDATQEILVKVITHLGELRDLDGAGAWVFRIACRHLVHVRVQGRVEAQRLTFRAFAADLDEGLQERRDDSLRDPETLAAIEQVKIGCTLAMLICLPRPVRAAYVLGEIFELSDTEAAFALEIEPAAFRQRLKRARTLVIGFVQSRCGIASSDAACRCDRRVMHAVRLGRVTRDPPAFATDPAAPSVAEVRASIARLEGARATAALMRSNPDFTTEVGRLISSILDADGRDGTMRPSPSVS